MEEKSITILYENIRYFFLLFSTFSFVGGAVSGGTLCGTSAKVCCNTTGKVMPSSFLPHVVSAAVDCSRSQVKSDVQYEIGCVTHFTKEHFKTSGGYWKSVSNPSA